MKVLELRHLRTLAALRDTGTLVEAAERVSLTQSALSHQLKDLESRVGCSLFVRKTRPVRFTSAGRRLVELADDMLPRIREAAADLARLVDGRNGRLSMAIECHSCVEWLLPSIDAYREDWPDVELDIAGGFNFEPLPALVRGDLDLVVTSDPITCGELTYLPLFGYEARLAVSRTHRLAGQDWIAAAELATETLITYPVSRSRLDVFTRFLSPHDVEPGSVRTAELTPVMVQLVASGRGVCCLPNWALYDYAARGAVVSCSLGEEGVWPNLYAAVRTGQRDAPYLAAFVALAKKTCFKTLVGVVPADEDMAAAT